MIIFLKLDDRPLATALPMRLGVHAQRVSG
jgi:hypothetical protein